MQAPSLHIHRTPTGLLKVIVISDEAQESFDSFKESTAPGEDYYIRKGKLDRSRKIKDAKLIKRESDSKAAAIKQAAAEGFTDAEPEEKVAKKAAKKA